MSGAMSAAVGGGGVIMVILVLFMIAQVSTISPPLGSRGHRGSVAGVRGGLPAYCPLRTAPPPHHHEPS
ncbi:Uncharacterized protein OBRU01_18564, partial [Operophtera brumata]